MKTKIIAVAGPTASGKTSLAIEIAKAVGGEVLSNDSMQVYRGMEIGTAAPTVEEMDGIVHHMVGVCDPSDEFSCADYSARAREIIEDIASRGKVPVFCGGTGLYLDSVLSVSDMSESGKDDGVRERLSEFAEKEGNEALHARLREIDPEAAD
ncbi:MAG: tRNA (adenosine(37)-N6)-dimethylallyltransferase MiaA, partial [Clostridia bacterium]|nr:tRNA (adenosine(37)-N6)-dimethylallyltransferase MiaA [Clostridia bacterium]